MIYTIGGNLFDYEKPHNNTYHITDIAHALSLITRFNGHIEERYSVAQHSVYCSYKCSNPMWGLMHDAAEAYVGDIPTPLKRLLPCFSEKEEEIMAAIQKQFELGEPPADLKLVDRKMLATEASFFAHELIGISEVPYADINCEPWSESEAKIRFLQRFNELCIQ